MKIVFVKLGGSLITNKNQPRSARVEIIQRIADELKQVLIDDRELSIILGHGSGSFGHVSAKFHNTINGVNSQEGWRGFINVWHDARELNRIVVDIFDRSGVNVLTFSPSSAVIANNRVIKSWDIEPLKKALACNIIPVVYGDVVFDEKIGGTILSTEDLFVYLAKELMPSRILIAGEEQGAYEDFPHNKSVIQRISNDNFDELKNKILGSKYIDVTGGMLQKVRTLLDLTRSLPNVEILLFSGNEENSVINAFLGKKSGTIVQK